MFMLKSVFKTKWLPFKKRTTTHSFDIVRNISVSFSRSQNVLCKSLHLSLWLMRSSPTSLIQYLCIMIQTLPSNNEYIMIETLVSNNDYSLSQGSRCALVCGHMEASQYSCITITLILSCLVYLLTGKNNHPAF